MRKTLASLMAVAAAAAALAATAGAAATQTLQFTATEAPGARDVDSDRSGSFTVGDTSPWLLSIAAVSGLVTRHVIGPDVSREVCLVTVAGRRWSSPVAAFVKAARTHTWATEAPVPSLAVPQCGAGREAGAATAAAGSRASSESAR